MKVAIDIGPLTSGDKIRGVGFYTRELIRGLENESKSDKKLEIIKLDSKSIVTKAKNFDVIHIPYFNPFFETVPTQVSTKIVVTIHDVIPLLYPEKYPSGVKGKLNLLKQRKALKSVAAVITDSEASKKDIVRYLGVENKKIYPIHLAPAGHFKKVIGNKLQETRKKFDLPNKFILYVGDINYNKNILSLIEAAKIIDVPLVIVGKQAKEIDNYDINIMNLNGPRDWVRYLFGKPHPEVAHYQGILNALNNAEVYRLGFVSDNDLVHIYNLATVYCQPSYAEGFGLPVLEAAACGAPLVVSRTQALVEIAENAVLFANPKDQEDIANKLKSIIKSEKLQKKYSSKSLELVKKYSWKKTARETVAVYKLTSKG